MARVHLEYDCCEEPNVEFNISTVRLNTSFKHIVSHLDDVKIASSRISDVENMIREQEWKRLHTSSHNTYSALVYICFILIGLYRVIHKSLRDFRTRLRNNQDRHGRKEHIYS